MDGGNIMAKKLRIDYKNTKRIKIQKVNVLPPIGIPFSPYITITRKQFNKKFIKDIIEKYA